MRVLHQTVRSLLWAAFLLTGASLSLALLTGQSLVPTAFAQNVVVANSATFANDNTAAQNSIAAAFGVFKTQNDQVFSATTRPLPTTLGGIRLTVNGVDAAARWWRESRIVTISDWALFSAPALVASTMTWG